MRAVLAAAATAAALLGHSAVADAEAPGDPVAVARELMAELQYDAARASLVDAIEAGGLDRESLADAYRALAECAAATRDVESAEDAFRRLLVVRPDAYVATTASPVLRRPFEAAVRYWREHPRPQLLFTPPRSVRRGEALVVEPEVERGAIPEMLAGLTVHLLRSGGRWVVHEGPLEGVEIPARELEGLEVATFYLVGRDAHGNVVAAVGSEEEPLEVALGEQRERAPLAEAPGPTVGADRPWYGQWWFWTAVGAVVLAVAITVPLVVVASEEDVCQRNVGMPCGEAILFEF